MIDRFLIDNFGIIILVVLTIVFIAYCFNSSPKHPLENYKKITLGMSEKEMLAIMNSNYDKSLLKDGTVLYVWYKHATSYSVGYERVYTGIHKVTVSVRNGIVEEVKPYNVISNAQ